MSDFVTLTEAATFLGVSKGTLRNWDRSGKLNAVRHPGNDYRLYALADLRQLKAQLSLFEEEPKSEIPTSLTSREVRRVVARLHNIIRDNDGGSNLLERFDELSKLLFLGLMAARDSETRDALKDTQASTRAYANRLRADYERLIRQTDLPAPEQFQRVRSSDQTIADCGRALAAVDFANSDVDVKGLAYEEVIKRTFDKTDNQQFFTPSPVVEFIIDMMGELSGAICDPAAGTGGFLVEIARRASDYSSLTALEIDERLAWTAGLNILLHGGHTVRAIHLTEGGSLGSGGEKFRSAFDTIVTNPPFGSDYSDLDGLRNYTLGSDRTSRRRGILFIERCWQFLRENGELAIIIDEGVLNLPHARDVRHFIFEHFQLEAIVSLPESAFMPYASVNAAILFLRKKGQGHDAASPVFFGRADKIGRRSNGDEDIVYASDGSSRPNSDLPNLLKIWRNGPTGEESHSELAYWATIEIDGSLDDEIRLDFRFHHPSREEAAERLKVARWPLISVAELCDEINESMIPAKEMPDTVILYTGLAHIEAETGRAVQEPTPTNSLKSAVKRYEPGDILFAKMRPNLRKVSLMHFDEGGYTSPECMVLRPLQGDMGEFLFEPAALAALLRSDLVFGQITHQIAGIGRPRLSGSAVKQVLLPLPPRPVQEEATRTHQANLRTANALREQGERMIEEADSREGASIEDLAEMIVGASQ